MKCDLCKKPAVVHELQITDGIKREIHLCQEHAAQQGFADIQGMSMEHFSTKVGSAAVQSPACPACGMTAPQIRQSSHFGCPQCFDALEGPVSHMIEQHQPNGTQHVGRRPAGTNEDIARRHETHRLMHELETAIAAEQYERAAQIRDELARSSRSAPADAARPSDDAEL